MMIFVLGSETFRNSIIAELRYWLKILQKTTDCLISRHPCEVGSRGAESSEKKAINNNNNEAAKGDPATPGSGTVLSNFFVEFSSPRV